MNDSLQRYVDFRRMMLQQATGERLGPAVMPRAVEGESGQADERLLMQRSANLQEAVAQIEAMRLTMKAVSEMVTSSLSVERRAA